MITHVVLLRPRAELSPDDRAGVTEALRSAIRLIPSIRGVRVGRRVIHGRGYEASMRNYEYAAFLDFDDLAGLQMYLDHPAHHALARRFFDALDEALMYDFDVEEGEKGLANLR